MTILIFACLMGLTMSAPQGYNYQQQGSFSVGHPQIGGLATSGTGSTSSSYKLSMMKGHSSTQEGLAFLKQALTTPKLAQTLIGGGQHLSLVQPNINQRPQTSLIPQSFGITQPHQHQFPQQNFNRPAPVVTKDIYVHVAPEEPDEHFNQQHSSIAQSPPRKHYRIVFIKAPIPKFSNGAALRLQQAQTEEKTIIYVLTKKPDPLDLETAIQESVPKPPSKPEVYFIKYKTQEEAQHAQRTIQAQYDKLGGTTQISDEGVAPVTSVIGALEHSTSTVKHSSGFNIDAPSATYSGAQVTSGSKSSQYLPPIVRL